MDPIAGFCIFPDTGLPRQVVALRMKGGPPELGDGFDLVDTYGGFEHGTTIAKNKELSHQLTTH